MWTFWSGHQILCSTRPTARIEVGMMKVLDDYPLHLKMWIMGCNTIHRSKKCRTSNLNTYSFVSWCTYPITLSHTYPITLSRTYPITLSRQQALEVIAGREERKHYQFLYTPVASWSRNWKFPKHQKPTWRTSYLHLANNEWNNRCSSSCWIQTILAKIGQKITALWFFYSAQYCRSTLQHRWGQHSWQT